MFLMALVWCFSFTAVSASGMSVASAVKILKQTNPELIQSITRDAPTVLPALMHKHQSMGKKLLGLVGRAGLGCVALVLFAIINDQFTARASKEYFSEGFHKDNMNSFAPKTRAWLAKKDSATLWAIAWGVVAGGSMGIMAGPAISLASLFTNAPPVKLRTLLFLMLGAIGVTSAGTLYAYNNADQVADIGLPNNDTLFRDSDRTGYMNAFVREMGVDYGAAERMGEHGREQYYRTAAAHGALYGIGQPSILVVIAAIVALRIYLQARYKKERVVVDQLLGDALASFDDEVTEASDYFSAIQTVQNAL